MFKNIIQMIKEALANFVGLNNVAQSLNTNQSLVSEDMSEHIDKWKNIYMNKAPWIDNDVKTLNIAQKVCSLVATLMINELKFRVLPKGYDMDADVGVADDSWFAWLTQHVDDKLFNKLHNMIERGLAVGGVIIKPYVANSTIYYDYAVQGDFLPLAYDDDGRMIDVAFIDQFVAKDMLYTRVERHTFQDNQVVVENKAYQAKFVRENQKLGVQIRLADVPQWAQLSEEPVTIKTDRPLYGYFKVARANNVDWKSNLGVSFFHPAISSIERLDKQYARLDWEYEGGQLAIDVDPTAMEHTSKTCEQLRLPNYDKRIFRFVDVGQDDTYKPYNPTLRDDNYIAGGNEYKIEIEDALGLARGALSKVESQARTATELKILKQESYDTIQANQEALEYALEDVIYATYIMASIYNGTDLQTPKPEEYETVYNWGDSIIVDKETEINNKLELVREGIISKAEFRAWYNDESIAAAKEAIDSIVEDNQARMLNSVLGGINAKDKEDTKEDDNSNSNLQAKKKKEQEE